MSWLRKDKTLEQGTGRWQNLHKCLRSFAEDMWSYYELLDAKDRDLQKIRTKIDAIESDLRSAEKTWPEGKSILERMRYWLGKMIQVRDEEQRLVEWSIAHPQQWASKGFEKQMRENSLYIEADNEMKKKLDLTGKGILDCSDEIKKWTSIDLRIWLEGNKQ